MAGSVSIRLWRAGHGFGLEFRLKVQLGFSRLKVRLGVIGRLGPHQRLEVLLVGQGTLASSQSATPATRGQPPGFSSLAGGGPPSCCRLLCPGVPGPRKRLLYPRR